MKFDFFLQNARTAFYNLYYDYLDLITGQALLRGSIPLKEKKNGLISQGKLKYTIKKYQKGLKSPRNSTISIKAGTSNQNNAQIAKIEQNFL